MNVSGSQNNQVQFGTIAQGAKKAINRADVRTILEKGYGITGKEIRQMDESAIKIDLLSSSFNRKGDTFQLKELSGLTVAAPKGSNIDYQTITEANNGIIQEATPQMFAGFVKKAFDMVQSYKDELKVFASHPIAKAGRLVEVREELPLRKMLSNYARAYNSGANDEVLSIRSKLGEMAERTAILNADVQDVKGLTKTKLAASVNSDWANINTGF